MNKVNIYLYRLERHLAFLALLLACILLFFGNRFDTSGESFWSSVFVEIGTALFAFAFIYFIWDNIKKPIALEEQNQHLKKELDEQSDSMKGFITQEINEALGSLRYERTDIAFRHAASLLPHSEIVRILGIINFNRRSNEVGLNISDFLRLLEARVVDYELFKLRILASTKLHYIFNKFFVKWFSNKAQATDFKLLLTQNPIPLLTYVIVDTKYLIVIFNFPGKTQSFKIQFCFVTENKSIIDNFISNFRSTWNEERIENKEIDSKESYHYYSDLFEKSDSTIERIRKSITKGSKFEHIFQNHIIRELDLALERMKVIDNYEFEVQHSLPSGTLLRLYSYFLNRMEPGDTYETITFYSFWNNVFSRGKRDPDFIRDNKAAIQKGANITRIFVLNEELVLFDEANHNAENIDKNKYQGYLNLLSSKKVLEENLRLLYEVEPKHTYDFKILFSNKHEDYRARLINFALLKKGGNQEEMVLFEPGDINYNGSTKLWLYKEDYLNTHTNMENVLHTIMNKQIDYDEVYATWIGQEIKPEQLSFLRRVIPNLFGLDERRIQLILGNQYHK